jgi:hypothetical protein
MTSCLEQQYAKGSGNKKLCLTGASTPGQEETSLILTAQPATALRLQFVKLFCILLKEGVPFLMMETGP